MRDIYEVRNLGIFSNVNIWHWIQEHEMGDENMGITLKYPQISYPTNMSSKVFISRWVVTREITWIIITLTTNRGIIYHWLLQHVNQPSSHHFPVVLHSIVAFRWSLFQFFSLLESSTVMVHTDSDPSICTLWHICQHSIQQSSSPVSPRSVSKSVTLPPFKFSEIFWMPRCMPNG